MTLKRTYLICRTGEVPALRHEAVNHHAASPTVGVLRAGGAFAGHFFLDSPGLIDCTDWSGLGGRRRVAFAGRSTCWCWARPWGLPLHAAPSSHVGGSTCRGGGAEKTPLPAQPSPVCRLKAPSPWRAGGLGWIIAILFSAGKSLPL